MVLVCVPLVEGLIKPVYNLNFTDQELFSNSSVTFDNLFVSNDVFIGGDVVNVSMVNVSGNVLLKNGGSIQWYNSSGVNRSILTYNSNNILKIDNSMDVQIGTNLSVNNGSINVISDGDKFAFYENDVSKTDAYFKLTGGTGTSNLFYPLIWSKSNNAAGSGLWFVGDTTTDTGTQPIVQFQARYNNGLVTTRPVFSFQNFAEGSGQGKQIMEMLPNVKIVIGEGTPVYRLEVKGTNSTINQTQEGIRSYAGYDIYTVPEPTAPIVTVTNNTCNVTDGYHYYVVTYTTPLGETKAGTATAQIPVHNASVNLTIPVSTDPRVTGRKIYRTPKNEPVYNDKLLATITNNIQTYYDDCKNDSLLTSSGSYFRGDTTTNYLSMDGVKIFDPDTSNIKIGSGVAAALTSGGRGVYMGNGVAASATTSTDVVCIGHAACSGLTTGGQTVAIGYGAAYTAAGGQSNTAIGHGTCFYMGGGSSNTCLGAFAGFGTATARTLSYNTLLGLGAGQSIQGSSNTHVGYYAGYLSDVNTENVYIGSGSANYQNGSYNTIIGSGAGFYQNSTLRTYNSDANVIIGRYAARTLMGDNNIIIGYNTAQSTKGNNNIIIGTSINALDENVSYFLNIGGVIYGNLTSKNVGIGTLTPTMKLDVNGSVNISGNVFVTGNVSFRRPYGMYSDITTQSVLVADTAQPVNFSNTEDDYLITKSSDNRNFTFQQSGDYLIELSAILDNDLPNKHTEMWVSKNGVNVPRSNTKMQLTSATTETVLSVPFILDMNKGDYLTIMMAGDDTGNKLLYTTNTSYSPETPSIIMTISKISEIT